MGFQENNYLCTTQTPSIMKATEQTTAQIERVIRKIAQKFADKEETPTLTDIHLRVSQESGELRAYDDDDNEITRCVVEAWINSTDEQFFEHVTGVCRSVLQAHRQTVDAILVLKPYHWVLEDEDSDDMAELYVADDDTVIVGVDLMKDLDKELDEFFENLMKDTE